MGNDRDVSSQVHLHGYPKFQPIEDPGTDTSALVASIARRQHGVWGVVSPPIRVDVIRRSGPGTAWPGRRSGGGQWDSRLTVHRSRVLIEEDFCVVDGFPVTSMARTFLDLASVVSERKLEAAITEAERMRKVRSSELDEILKRGPGWRGIGKLRRVLDRWNPESQKSNRWDQIARSCWSGAT